VVDGRAETGRQKLAVGGADHETGAMAGLGRISALLRGRAARPDPTEAVVAPNDLPSSLYLFGPTWVLGVGKRLDYATVDPASPSGLREFSDQPGFYGHWGTVGDPGDQRIWRLVADDPKTLRPTPRPGRWVCRSATVVEELSPTIVMPAWPEVVRLCARLRALTHDEAVRIAAAMNDGQYGLPGGATTRAGWWASWSVGAAARGADTADRPVMRYYRAGGGSYEDIIDPAWVRIEAAAVELGDGLASGTATLANDGAPFGRWPTAGD